MRRAIRAGSSTGTRAGCRCVLRGWARTRQARRSETASAVRTCVTACRRRAGLRSFPPATSLRMALSRGLIGHQPLQPGVLPLPRLAPFGLVHPQAAGLAPPAVVRLLGNAEPSRDLGHTLALGKHHLRLPQLRDDLLRRVPLPRHADSPPPRPAILAQDLDRFWGGRSTPRSPHSSGSTCN